VWSGRRSAVGADQRPVLQVDHSPMAHSPFITARMIPIRKTEDLLLGTRELLQQLGRVPRRLIWDDEPGIGRGQRRANCAVSFNHHAPRPPPVMMSCGISVTTTGRSG